VIDGGNSQGRPVVAMILSSSVLTLIWFGRIAIGVDSRSKCGLGCGK
jgi:hypothetical protein